MEGGCPCAPGPISLRSNELHLCKLHLCLLAACARRYVSMWQGSCNVNIKRPDLTVRKGSDACMSPVATLALRPAMLATVRARCHAAQTAPWTCSRCQLLWWVQQATCSLTAHACAAVAAGCVPSNQVPPVHHCVHHLYRTPQGAVSVLWALHALTGATVQRPACHQRQRCRVPLCKYLVLTVRTARTGLRAQRELLISTCSAASTDVLCIGCARAKSDSWCADCCTPSRLPLS